MGTPHIGANKGDFAKVVLMPGDPLRAKFIVDNFLKDVKLVNEVRGILGYTGYTKNGKRISVMASGMGVASIGIYSHELFTHFDVETIIRVGTAGAYQDELNLFDVIVASTSSSDSNYLSQLNLNGHYAASADFDLVIDAYNVLKSKKIPFKVGNIFSSDVFYDFDKDTYKKWAQLGVLGVEMESYSLYINAAYLKKRALTLLTVTDHFTKKGKIATPKERQEGLSKMIEVAIEVGEKYA